MHEIPLLVVSCDKYEDVWQPFFEVLALQWPDRSLPVYLGSNHRVSPLDWVHAIPVGPDRSWSENLIEMLDAIDAPYVILLLEDFFLVEPVNDARVQHLVEIAVDHRVGCLRLFPHPSPSRRIPDMPGLGEIRRGDHWRVSTQAAIWDTELLRALAWPGFSAWDFEVIGSLISYAYPHRFFGVYESALHYMQVVWQGEWHPQGLAICRELGVTPDLERRAVLDESLLPAKARSFDRYSIPPSHWHIASVYARYLRLMRPRHYIRKLLKQSDICTAENMRRLNELTFSVLR